MNKHHLNHFGFFAPADEGGGGGGGGAPASKVGDAPAAPKNAVLNIWGEAQPKPAPVVTEKDLKKAGKTGKTAVNKDDDDDDEGAAEEGGAFDPDSEAFETGKHAGKSGKKKTPKPKDDDDEGALTDDEPEDDEEGGENEEEIDLELEGEDPDAPLSEKKVSGKGSKSLREQVQLQSAANKKLLAELETYKKKVAKYETVATEDILEDVEDAAAPDLKTDEKFQGFRTSVTKRLNNAVAGTGNQAASEWADQEMSSTLETLYTAMSGATTASAKAQVAERFKKRLAREFADDKTDDDGTKAAERIINSMVDSFPDLEAMYARRDEVVKAPTSKRDQGTLYGVRRAQAEELVAAAAADYPEALTAKNPHGVEAYLQGLSKHPKYGDRVKRARDSVASLLAGPPELSKEDAAKIKAAKGEKGVSAAREALRKDWNANRSTLATKLVEALVFFPQVGPLLKELHSLRGKTEEEDDERETLAESRGATSKVPARKANASPQKRLIQDLYGPASRI